MANIDNHYDKILTEASGEIVRDNIINAANLLKQSTNNATSLNGIPANQFARSEKFAEYRNNIFGLEDDDPDKRIKGILAFDGLDDIKNDDSYALSSTNLLSSGDIYNILDDYVRASLAKLVNSEVDPAAEMTMKNAILQYLSDLKKAKDKINKALIGKGQDPSKTKIVAPPYDDPTKKKSVTTFREYADVIRQIGELAVETEEVTINENHKTKDANDEKPPSQVPKTYAYNKVVVNVTSNLKDVSFSKAEDNKKTHLVSEEEEKCDGWKKVTVNISGGASSSKIGGRKTGKDGVIIDDNDIMSSKEITDKAVHSASEDGVVGWNTVNVKVQVEQLPEGATFKVTFMYEDNELQTVDVPAYGNAKFTGEVPMTKDMGGGHIRYFAGWSPKPILVMSDMTCEAVYRPAAPPSDTEINDPWSTIVSTGGEGYNIGQYKPLKLGDSKGTLYMQKIAEGEDGTTSTWIAKNVMNTSYGSYLNWWNSDLRKYLNNDILIAMQHGSEEANLVADSIIPVTKMSLGGLNTTYGMVEMETVDRIWIPSAREIFGEHDQTKVAKLITDAYNGFDPNNPYNPSSPDVVAAYPYRREFYSYYRGTSQYYPYVNTNANFHYNYIGEERYSYRYDQFFGGSSWTYRYTHPSDELNRKNQGNGVDTDIDLWPVATDPSKLIRYDSSNTNASVYRLRSIGQYKGTMNMRPNESNSGPQRCYPGIIGTTGNYSVGDYGTNYPVIIGFCL